MTVKRSEKLWGLTEKGPRQVGADRMCQVQRGQRDQGAEGLPLGYRGYMALAGAGQGGHWLPARRNLSDPGELACHVCYGPSGTTLEEPAKVADTRWPIEECFEETKEQLGLDQYEVRRWDGW